MQRIAACAGSDAHVSRLLHIHALFRPGLVGSNEGG
jgi:hypothetical protein